MADTFSPFVKSELDALEKATQKVITSKSISGFIKPSKEVLSSIIKDAHSGQLSFNTVFKSFTITAAALIPYGGSFIAPLLELLWPNPDVVKENNNQMIELFAKIANEAADQAVKALDSATLSAHLKTLKSQYITFENHLTSNNFQTELQTDIHDLNANFELALNLAEKSGYEISELPFYTAIATIYILFLQSVVKNGMTSKVNLKPQIYNEYVTILTNFPREAEKHITSTYYDYVKAHTIPYRDYYFATIKNSTFWYVLQRNTWITENGKWFYLDDKGNKLTGWYSPRTTNAYFPLYESNAYYYLSPEKTNKFEIGEAITGFFTDKNGKEYYLSEEDNLKLFFEPYLQNPLFKTINKYELATGFFELKDYRAFCAEFPGIAKLFIISPVPRNTAEGELLTGWIQDPHSHYYYYAPKDNFTNSAGKKFQKGQMVTGWIQEGSLWYYLAETYMTNQNNKGFNVGVMTTGDILISGKLYSFNSDGKCTNC